MESISRPITNLEEFENALKKADLEDVDRELIDYIRFIGTFTQPILTKDLNIKAKPPILSRLCEACRKIGEYMPEHFELVREWSKQVSNEGVRWDGDLICSSAFNIDGERLAPEAKTALFHNFAVHRELFKGFD